MFLIYINDSPDNIQSTCNIFADDTFLFLHVSDKSTSRNEMNEDLQAINNWVFQWKIQFNSDSNKQAQEVYFSKKINNVSPLSFNNTKVVTCSSQKHSGLMLGQQPNFNDDIQSKMTNYYKMIDTIKRLSVNIPRDALLSIYKSFIRPHLNYGAIIYDKLNNE